MLDAQRNLSFGSQICSAQHALAKIIEPIWILSRYYVGCIDAASGRLFEALFYVCDSALTHISIGAVQFGVFGHVERKANAAYLDSRKYPWQISLKIAFYAAIAKTSGLFDKREAQRLQRASGRLVFHQHAASRNALSFADVSSLREA